MFSLFHLSRHNSMPPAFGTGFLTGGLFCLFFGIAIFAEPDLVAYFIASFLSVTGVALLLTWWRLRGGR